MLLSLARILSTPPGEIGLGFLPVGFGGWAIVADLRELPAAFSLDLYAINRPKHALWIGVITSPKDVLGRLEKIIPGRYHPDL